MRAVASLAARLQLAHRPPTPNAGHPDSASGAAKRHRRRAVAGRRISLPPRQLDRTRSDGEVAKRSADSNDDLVQEVLADAAAWPLLEEDFVVVSSSQNRTLS